MSNTTVLLKLKLPYCQIRLDGLYITNFRIEIYKKISPQEIQFGYVVICIQTSISSSNSLSLVQDSSDLTYTADDTFYGETILS